MRLCLILIASAGSFTQQPSATPAAGDPVIRLNVRQVLVPVIVSDKKGHHVSGLHASDFRILEDGAPQAIAAFSTDTVASVDDVSAFSKPGSDAAATSGAPSAATATARTEPRRTYVICIDTLHSSPADAARIREALENFFHEQKGTGAQYVLIGIGRQLQVLQTATANPLAVLLKIRGSGFQSALGGPDAAALAAQLNNLHTRMAAFCRTCACGVRSNPRNCGSEIDTLKQSVDSDAERWTALSDGVAQQFKNVVEELAKLPTGRTLLLVSDGFNLDPKREFYAEVATWLPASPQFRVEDGKSAKSGIEDALKIAADRNVIIYGIDLPGGAYAPALASTGAMDASGSGGGGEGQSVIRRGSSSPMRSATLQAAPGQNSSSPAARESETMAQLANATGGIYFHEGKDLAKELRTAVADGREYYVLAYVPKNSEADNKFRRITVEVPGKNLSVRAKAGYWPGRSDQ